MCNAQFLMAYYSRLREQYGDQLIYIRNWISYGIDEYNYYSEEYDGVQPFWNPPELKPDEPPAQQTMEPPTVEPENELRPEPPTQEPPPHDNTFGFEMVDIPPKED
jgi:hypothetical protein